MQFLCLFFFILTAAPLFAAEHTFLLQDVHSNQILIQEGSDSIQMSPYSTFKIVLSLIGFDANILLEEETPVWQFEEKYKSWSDFFLEKWEKPHNPKTWMQNSCIWFSQVLTQKLGMQAFTDYILVLEYGNQNLTGDKDKNNGLTHAWLGSSLRISPLEQLSFINRLINQELPVSTHAHEMTKAILFVETLPNGMTLFGKTGSGFHALGQESDLKIGWFIGWVEQEDRKLSFVYVMYGHDPEIWGATTKEHLKQRLLQLEEIK